MLNVHQTVTNMFPYQPTTLKILTKYDVATFATVGLSVGGWANLTYGWAKPTAGWDDTKASWANPTAGWANPTAGWANPTAGWAYPSAG